MLRRYVGAASTASRRWAWLTTPPQPMACTCFTFEQAEAKARAMVATPGDDKIERLTVRQAMELYIDYKRT